MLWRSAVRTKARVAHGRTAQQRSRFGLECLESRLLLSTDYLLNGNQLTVTTNGVAGSPQTVSDINNVVLTGDSGVNRFTVQNFSGNVTIDGAGGGDTVTVYTGSGGTVSLHDSAATSGTLDTLIIHAPSSVPANLTMSETQATIGADRINYDGTTGTISAIGQIFATGDSLTINGTQASQAIGVNSSSVSVGGGPTIYYSTFSALAVNGTGDGAAITINGDSLPTTATLGTGNGSIIVNANSVPLTLVGGAGDDSFTINSNSGPLAATGSAGASTFILNGSSAGIILNGGSGTNAYQVSGNSGTLTINGAGSANAVTVDGNTGGVTVYGAGGSDTFTVNSTTGAITLRGGTGTTNYVVTAPTLAPVTVVGNPSGAGALSFSGTPVLDAFTITSTSLTAGTGAVVNYSGLNSVAVNGLGGDDTFQVMSSGTPLFLNGSTGNSTFNIRANTAVTTVSTGSGVSTVNIGSNAPGVINNTLTPIVGGVAVAGDGLDTVNIDDSAATTARNITLSESTLAGFTAGTISYAGVAVLNLSMGTGADTVNVTGTAAGTATTLNAGAGSNIFTVGSAAPATGGNLDAVNGNISLTGSGSNALVVDDSGGSVVRNGTLDAATLAGMSNGTLTYHGMGSLTVNLGIAGNAFAINATNAATPTTVNGGSGNDMILLNGNASATTIATGGGSDVIGILANTAATVVHSSGNSSIVVGSAAPGSGGVLSTILGSVSVTGGGASGDVLTLDDTGDAVSTGGVLTGSSVTGLGLGSAGVSYAGIATLNVNLGDAGNTFSISNTAAGTTTNVTGGSGADTITVMDDSDAVNIATQGGGDIVNVRGVHGATTIQTGAEGDIVNVGSQEPAGGNVLSGIAAPLNLQGGGATVNIDDGADGTGRSGILSASSLTGFSGGAITYGPIGTLNVTFGSGNDALQIVGTGAVTNVAMGDGNDTGNIRAIQNATTITTGRGINTVNIGSGAPGPSGILAGIGADLTVNGSGADSLNVTDSADGANTQAALTATALTGLSPGAIAFSGLAAMSVSLGSGADVVTVSGTIAGSTTLTTNAGDDTVLVQGTGGPLTVDTGMGNNTVNVQGSGGDVVINSAAGANNVLNIGSSAPVMHGSLGGIAGAVTLNGNGVDALNIDASGSAAAVAGTLTNAAVTGLSAGAMNYNGVATLNLDLSAFDDVFTVAGTAAGAATTIDGNGGGDTLNVQSISSPTVINAGAGVNTVNVGSAAPASGGTLDGIAAGLTINGGGAGTLNVDDTGSTAAKTGVLSATQVSGLSTGTINYSQVVALNVALGAGDDQFTIADTAADDVSKLSTGAGQNLVTVNAAHGSTVVATGNGHATVNVMGTSAPLAVELGGVDTLNVCSISAGMSAAVDPGAIATIHVGSTAPGSGGTVGTIGGALAVEGNANTTLDIDDTGASAGKTLEFAATTISGISPGIISYQNVGGLFIALSDVGNTIDVASTGGAAITTINGGAGDDAFAVTAGNLAGALALHGETGADRLTVDASAQTAAENVVFTDGTISGLGGTIAYDGFTSLALTLGQADDTLTLTGKAPETSTTIDGGAGSNAAAVAIGGNLEGDLSLIRFASGSVTIGGNLDGLLRDDGGLSSAAIGRNIAAGAGLEVSGRIDALTLGGGQAGTIQAGGGFGCMQLNGLVPDGSGTLWNVSDGGVTRQVSALSADGGALTGLSFSLFYDNAGTTPAVAIRINDSDPAGARFDLVVSTPPTATLDLERLDSSSDSATRVRNVVVSGSLRRTTSAAAAAAMGVSASSGGIDLPDDALGAVSVRDDLYSRSVFAASFQGISFSRFIDVFDVPHASTSVKGGSLAIRFASVLNPATKQPYTHVALPTEPLLMVVGNSPVELFTSEAALRRGSLATTGHYSQVGLELTNNSNESTMATVTFRADVPSRRMVISSLAIAGEHTSVNTAERVENISSTGSLDEVNLRAGRAETLYGLEASGTIGAVHLNRGKYVGSDLSLVQALMAGRSRKAAKRHIRRKGLPAS